MYIYEMSREIRMLNNKFLTIDEEYKKIVQKKDEEIEGLKTAIKEAHIVTDDQLLLSQIEKLKREEQDLVKTVTYFYKEFGVRCKDQASER